MWTGKVQIHGFVTEPQDLSVQRKGLLDPFGGRSALAVRLGVGGSRSDPEGFCRTVLWDCVCLPVVAVSQIYPI